MVVFIFIPTLIAMLYMGGWLSHWTEFLTLIPNSPPMVFNTALCLFLLGLNALAFQGRSLKWFRQAWIAVFLLAGFSGLQYAWNIQLGLDELFTSAYLRSFRSDPGRMSPITSVSLTLLSFIWGCRMHFYGDRRFFIWAQALIASALVMMLGLLSLLEYGFSFQGSLSWGAFAKISFASAFCFFVLGIFSIDMIRGSLKSASRDPRHLRALLWGVFGLLATMAGWQYSNYQASLQINRALERELQNRYQQFYQAFQYRAEELQRTDLPVSPQDAEKNLWRPPFPSVKAVVKVSRHPYILWQSKSATDTSDLERWAAELEHARPDFAFYPNFIFQRERLMAFLFQDRLWIFSPQIVINLFFPEDQFTFALKMDNLVLATNQVGIVSVLQEWSVDLPLRLWNDQLSLEVTPTKATLGRLEPSTPQQILSLGLAMTTLLALIGYGLPMGRKRIKD